MSEADAWVTIRRAANRGALRGAALVLTAMDINHRIEHACEWELLVAQRDVPAANAELLNFAGENRNVKAPRPSPVIGNGVAGVVGYLIVICAPPALQIYLDLGFSLHDAGRLHAASVVDGQWWLAVTALTLHADLAHLAGNAAFGAIFGLLAGRYLGSGFAWLLILLSATLGNLLNARLQAPEFMSIGASTATFAALGLVAAMVWRRGHYRDESWRRSLAPLFAAFALFAYTGVGGERTDVGAHITGMLAGGVFGYLAASFDARMLGISGQRIAACVCVAILAIAWGLAIESA